MNSTELDLADFVGELIARYPGLSHRQASIDAGLANNAVTQIVNRAILKPNPTTLRKLAKKWGDENDFKTMMELAGHVPYKEKAQREEMSALEAERVIAALRKMTPEQRENAIRYVLERAKDQSEE